MFSLFPIADGEEVPMKAFDRKKKVKMSTIKEYRELSESWSNVKKGRYILVPR